MKISLITACYNSEATIRTAIESVLSQKGVDIEYIVVDGGSKDGTVEVVEEFSRKERKERKESFEFKWISESDRGMYDAINKGIKMATGDVVGILNADDVLADDDTLAKIAAAFADQTIDGTYGDIRFVRDRLDAKDANGATEISAPARRFTPGAELISVAVSDNTAPSVDLRQARSVEWTQSSLAQNSDLCVKKIRALPMVRYCSGKWFRPWMFRFGTQTAHPSTFFRKECFAKWGDYSLDYGMYGDFEFLCRFIWKHKARMKYLPLCTTVMRLGGASTKGLKSTLEINRTDMRALKANGCWSCYAMLYSRYIFKIWGFLKKTK